MADDFFANRALGIPTFVDDVFPADMINPNPGPPRVGPPIGAPGQNFIAPTPPRPVFIGGEGSALRAGLSGVRLPSLPQGSAIAALFGNPTDPALGAAIAQNPDAIVPAAVAAGVRPPTLGPSLGDLVAGTGMDGGAAPVGPGVPMPSPRPTMNQAAPAAGGAAPPAQQPPEANSMDSLGQMLRGVKAPTVPPPPTPQVRPAIPAQGKGVHGGADQIAQMLQQAFSGPNNTMSLGQAIRGGR